MKGMGSDEHTILGNFAFPDVPYTIIFISNTLPCILIFKDFYQYNISYKSRS